MSIEPMETDVALRRAPQSVTSVGATTPVGTPAVPGTQPHRRESRLARARRRDSFGRRSLALADVLALALALGAVEGVGDLKLGLATVAAAPVFIVIAKSLGMYDRDEHLVHKTTLDEIPALFAIASVMALLLALSGNQLGDGASGRGEVVVLWGSLFAGLIVLRSLARLVVRTITPTERCLLIGDTAMADLVREKLALTHAVGAKLIGAVSLEGFNARREPGGGDRAESILDAHDVDRVILASHREDSDDLMFMIRRLKDHGVKVSVLSDASRVAGSSLVLDHIHGMTLLGMRPFEFTRSSRFVKRSMDLIGASTALLFLSPLLVVTALAIRLDSRGPVLFRQQRVGRHGEDFSILKFRSMVDGADAQKKDLLHLNEGASGLFKIAADPRVTRVGRFIRRYQLDELPQLLNVLAGQMSLVGPRPLVPEEDRKIHGWYRRRLDVPPGITGHWQVLGSSSRVALDEMVKLDYLYVANWSLWGDVRLLLRTVPFIIGRRGL